MSAVFTGSPIIEHKQNISVYYVASYFDTLFVTREATYPSRPAAQVLVMLSDIREVITARSPAHLATLSTPGPPVASVSHPCFLQIRTIFYSTLCQLVVILSSVTLISRKLWLCWNCTRIVKLNKRKNFLHCIWIIRIIRIRMIYLSITSSFY